MTSKKSSLFLWVSIVQSAAENTQKCNKTEIIEINTCTVLICVLAITFVINGQYEEGEQRLGPFDL